MGKNRNRQSPRSSVKARRSTPSKAKIRDTAVKLQGQRNEMFRHNQILSAFSDALQKDLLRIEVIARERIHALVLTRIIDPKTTDALKQIVTICEEYTKKDKEDQELDRKVLGSEIKDAGNATSRSEKDGPEMAHSGQGNEDAGEK